MAKPGIHKVLDDEEAQALLIVKQKWGIASTRGTIKALLLYGAYGEPPPGIKEDNPDLEDVWVSSAEAARILTENTDHEIKPAYVRELARQGLIRTREQDGVGYAGRVNLYNVRDLTKIRVKRRQQQSTQQQERGEEQP